MNTKKRKAEVSERGKKRRKEKKKRIDLDALLVPATKRPLPEFTLQNVVATFNLGVDHLDLLQLVYELENRELRR